MSPREQPPQRIDLLGVRRRLEAEKGRRYWRSLEELAETPAFVEFLHREFPVAASELDDPAGRREFLRVMGASLALAGLTACTRQPEEHIVPYVRAPEDVVPGKPLFFATAALHGGYADGVLVESHMGRPTKVEGNPDHPVSRGSTDVFGQATVLGLYDPDRSQTLTHLGEIQPWGTFLATVKTALEAQKPLRGAGLRLLTETVTSPTLAAQIEALLADYPEARWHQYDPVLRDNVREGARLAFDEVVETQYRFEAAEVVLCLDADFVSMGPGRLAHIRGFTSRRKEPGGGARAGHGKASSPTLNRLYVVEGSPTLTGALADHRLPLRSSEIEAFARAVAEGLGLGVEGGRSHPWIQPLVRDLEAHRGAALVVAGEWQPAAVHALAHAMNQALGAPGRTVVYTSPVEARPVSQLASISELAGDMAAGKVDVLLVAGGNPVYTAPAELDFARVLDKVPLRIHLGLHDDETAQHCHWHVPEAHSLESWSDARAADGTVTLLQPLIAPLYSAAKSAHEIVAAFTSRPERSGHDLVREHWQARSGTADFEAWWQKALHDGVVPGTALPPRAVSVRLGEWARVPTVPVAAGLEIAFRPDPCVWDGRFANNGWLQELPKPLTKLTWDNAVLLGVETARALGVTLQTDFEGRVENTGEATARGTRSDVVEVRYRGRSLEAPAWIVPGHPEGAVTLHLGHGRTRAGRVGSGVGADVYRLRTAGAPWFDGGAEVRKTGETALVACTQDHWSLEGRNIVRAVTGVEYESDPHVIHAMGHEPKPGDSLYPSYRYDGYKWGMAIDLNSCVGCNACVVACQSENNIPVVGKEQVAMGREMHWLRIDRYYAGDTPEQALGNPETYHQPVPCMHCENAPCEVVCPVAATVHSDEGLNDMVYNRCVGTRYCSNNCPYKVRRFNFFLYSDWNTESLKLQRNPDVTVRSRGVMEKCTYCVQRINHARIQARNDGRDIRDGEARTACEQACPAEAIVFGDLNDPGSRVSRLKSSPRNYGILADLNTRPRTTYLAAVRNPNPEMPPA